jgi:hypothetical protein
MTRKRKPSSGDPRKHPGNDMLSVIYPARSILPPDGMDLDEWFELHPPEIRTENVTRDEFVRRMAGRLDVLRLLHESGRNTRVISLMDVDAIGQWWGQHHD